MQGVRSKPDPHPVGIKVALDSDTVDGVLRGRRLLTATLGIAGRREEQTTEEEKHGWRHGGILIAQ